DGPTGLPVGSSAVPADAFMTLTLSTEAEQWVQLRQFGTRETQSQLNQYIATWRDRLQSDVGLDYSQDIAPWVGRAVTVAFLAPRANSPDSLPELGNDDDDSPQPSNPFNPDLMTLERRSVVWMLPVDQPTNAQAALSRLESDAASAPQAYGGVDIYQFQGRSQDNEAQPYWAALLGRRLVAIAINRADVEAVIDAYGDAPSVADVPGYRQAIQRVATPQSFLQVYINSAAAAEVTAANSAQGTPPNLVPLQPENQGLVANASLTEAGIEIDSATWLKSGVGQSFTGNPVEDVASFLSPDTVFVMAGGNLQLLWQHLQQGSQTEGFLSADNIRKLVNAFTGLSLEEDLLPWMTDEYALALVAPSGSPESPMGLVLQLKTGDRSAAEASLTQLDESVRSRYDFQVAQNVVDGMPVVQWTSPLAALQVNRTWVDNNRVSIAVGAQPQPSSDQPLAQSDLFQAAIASSDKPSGYFFVNPARLVALDQGLPLPSIPPRLKSNAAAIRAIGLKTTIPSDRMMRFNIAVLLNRLADPGALPEPGAAQSQPVLPESETAIDESLDSSDGFITPLQ
ncbi:MAG: DUF3352 domain-containing protein, partial [Elainellaceae cyanobacterium]